MLMYLTELNFQYMKKNNSIKISEIFSSLQGEGYTQGTPAIFVRLSGCNLICDAEWTCDTLEVWRKGVVMEQDVIIKRIDRLLETANHDNTNIVFTGGEPLLKQNTLLPIIKHYSKDYVIELETNGTIIPDLLADYVDMFNVSPKLPNSGNPESKFYNTEALDYFIDNTSASFKFVITKEEDIIDIHKYYKDFIDRIGRFRVYLMPACQSQEEYAKTAPITAELCKKYGYNFSSRLQINIYNKKTGV